MKTYNATFEHKGEVLTATQFNADNLKEAKRLADFHKRHEVKRQCKVIVRLAK